MSCHETKVFIISSIFYESEKKLFFSFMVEIYLLFLHNI